jgi:hypothetical protein
LSILNSEIVELAKHSSQSIDSVVRVYQGGSTARIRERVKVSASVLGFDPPPEREDDDEIEELNFD